MTNQRNNVGGTISKLHIHEEHFFDLHITIEHIAPYGKEDAYYTNAL